MRLACRADLCIDNSDLSRSYYLSPSSPRPSYVQGQPGGNLPSGNQSEDALDYLLNGLYATTAGNADNPLEEEDLDDDVDGGGVAGKQDDAGASSPEQIEIGGGEGQQDEEGAIETQEIETDGSPGGGGVVLRRSQTTATTGTGGMTTPPKIMRMPRAGFRTDPTTGFTRFSSPTVLWGGQAAARILTSRPRGKRPAPRAAKGS